MKFITSLLLTAITIVAASPALAPRISSGAALILADLQNLDNSVKSLTSTISNYTGGLIPSLPILLAISSVNTANRKAYLDTMAIGNQSIPDSFTIVNYVNDTLVKDIPDGVNALEKKKGLFVEAGLTEVVIGGLELLKYDHESFSAALKSKAAPETYPQVDKVVKVIDDSLKDGIADFSS